MKEISLQKKKRNKSEKLTEMVHTINSVENLNEETEKNNNSSVNNIFTNSNAVNKSNE